MSTNTNKDLIVRAWYQELWDKWKVDTADQLLTEDYRFHLPGVPVAIDRAATKQVILMFKGSFPDLTHIVNEVVAEGETVAVRWTVQGTHRGEFQGIAARGKTVNVSGLAIHHLRDGKLSETWLSFDSMELLQQLGALPAAAKV